ncbi:hypothetical protein CEXT_440101 [Caerostris extrusa]|uniref:Uncharacterized protein n=1 Tax=Caerostris extrusa TaxID=172846 RepID=A0AAV4UGC4_CAEEX|nr:hypothetical protein CEXT_440101 [Caerostris extrusa]
MSDWFHPANKTIEKISPATGLQKSIWTPDVFIYNAIEVFLLYYLGTDVTSLSDISPNLERQISQLHGLTPLWGKIHRIRLTLFTRKKSRKPGIDPGIDSFLSLKRWPSSRSFLSLNE